MNMLSPKKTKYRKQFKGRIHGNAKGNYALNYGSFGLKALQPERITSRQIESARKAITRHLKRAGKMWIRICLLYTSPSPRDVEESRMPSSA